jgi:hypothetical protein
MFEVGFIVPGKSRLRYPPRNRGRLVLRDKGGEGEEVIRVYSRHSRRKNCRKSY